MSQPDSSATASSVRIDKWLWAVRIYKTRTLAADACKAGHVKINGHAVKPAYVVRLGETIEARAGDTLRIIRVTDFLEKRVSAKLVSNFMDDLTPVPDPASIEKIPNFIPVPMRSRGSGRPTKKERRQIDQLTD